MSRVLLLLVVVLAGLAALGRQLDRREARELAARRLTQPLLSDTDREQIAGGLAAIQLLGPGAERPLLYARVRGSWRCPSLYGAPVELEAIQDLVDDLFVAHGVAVRDDPLGYGLGPERGVRLTLHGPGVLKAEDEDLLLALEIGRSTDGTDGAWVARESSGDVADIWSVDRDLRAHLAGPAGTNLPPFIDPRIVPAAWSIAARAPERIEVRRPGASYAMERDGDAWVLRRAGAEDAPCHPVLSLGYTLFLARAPFRDVLDPRTPPETTGLDVPRGTITITPVNGEPLVLVVGGEAPGGGIPVANRDTGMLVTVEDEVARLLLPEPAALIDPARGNPWDPWLRQSP